MKRCSKCKEEKDEGEFNKLRRSKDRLNSHCRVCTRALSAAWEAANLEKVKAKNAAYRAANLEKVKAKNAAYRAANPEKAIANMAAYYAKNPEKVKAKKAAYRAELRDGYVRQLLIRGTDIKPSDIPHELVEFKREQLILTRELNKLKEELQ